jgi:hypothetical protein
MDTTETVSLEPAGINGALDGLDMPATSLEPPEKCAND